MKYLVSVACLLFLFCSPVLGELVEKYEDDLSTGGDWKAPVLIEEPAVVAASDLEADFENEDAYIDVLDALKSRKFMHRVILKEAISDSSHFELGRFYLNHLMGFSSIHQQSVDGSVEWTEYVSGLQGGSAGYVTTHGHALEIGLEFSAVSNIYAGYRYFYRTPKLAVWPFGGIGLGKEVTFFRLANGPDEAKRYAGKQNHFYGNLGLLMPLLDVGLKMEGKISFYGSDRMIFTTGVGMILFL